VSLSARSCRRARRAAAPSASPGRVLHPPGAARSEANRGEWYRDEAKRQRLVERVWLLQQLRAEAEARAGRATTAARRAQDAAVDDEHQAAALRDRVADLGEELADLHDQLGERSEASKERAAAEAERVEAAKERDTRLRNVG
jgi:hypothetical protein